TNNGWNPTFVDYLPGGNNISNFMLSAPTAYSPGNDFLNVKYIRGDNIGETPNCVDGSEDCPPTSTAYTTVQDPNHTLSDNSLSVSFIEVETIQVDIPVDELFCDDMAGDNDYRMSNGIQNTAAQITASVFPNPAHSFI